MSQIPAHLCYHAPHMLPDGKTDGIYEISLVVPVYQGERTLDALADEVAPMSAAQETVKGHRFRVIELLLVHDGAVDHSAQVMKALAGRYPFVRLVWLSRNFGQHAATLAGMASSVGDWSSRSTRTDSRTRATSASCSTAR